MDEHEYDKFKTSSPDETPENECLMCGEPCEGKTCSKECEEAWLDD